MSQYSSPESVLFGFPVTFVGPLVLGCVPALGDFFVASLCPKPTAAASMRIAIGMTNDCFNIFSPICKRFHHLEWGSAQSHLSQPARLWADAILLPWI